MTANHIDMLIPPSVLEPIWEDIDGLESRGCYKEAYQYLRTVTNELNLIRETRIGMCCALESDAETWSDFQSLQSLMVQHLEPIKENSKLMYLESLRTIMQSAHDALLNKMLFAELQVLLIELCSAYCEQHEDNSGARPRRAKLINQYRAPVRMQ